jgi:hypothetical protein
MDGVSNEKMKLKRKKQNDLKILRYSLRKRIKKEENEKRNSKKRSSKASGEKSF